MKCKTAAINLWNYIRGNWFLILHLHPPIKWHACPILHCHSASISCCSAFKPWLMFFFFFFSWSGTSQERKTFWCGDRDRLSLWQPRQLALIISANGKMRKRFFASPTSNSSSLWQLRRHRAAGRMFTQTDYGNARRPWMEASHSQFRPD